MKVDLLIQHIDCLYTMEGLEAPVFGEALDQIRPIRDGFVAVSGETIVAVGSGALPQELELTSDTVILDGRGKTVTPGLIDSHTHLVHGGSRENELAMKLEGKNYLEILAEGGGIYSTVRATQSATLDELYLKAEKSLRTMLTYGVTTVEAKSGYGLDDFATEIRQMETVKQLNENSDLDVISTYMGAHAVPAEFKANPMGFIEKIISEYLPYIKEHELAEFCDVFCEEGVFSVEESRVLLSKAKEMGFGIKLHADEIIPLKGAELAAELGCVSAEHLMAASDEGIAAMAKAGVIANLLPGTSFNLQKNIFARARTMIESGVPIAISTDYNPGSCPTENLQLVMSIAALAMKMKPHEILAAVTLNAAAAIRRDTLIGSLKPGKKADIVLFEAPNLEYILYHFGINHTNTVIKNGRIVYKYS